MFTDTKAADVLLDSYLSDKNSPYYRYFIFQGITIKLICEKYKEAYDLANLCLKLDMTSLYESYILSNIQVIKWKIVENLEKKVCFI